jgi:hypothetical protein
MRIKNIIIILAFTLSLVFVPINSAMGAKSFDTLLQNCSLTGSAKAYINFLSTLLDYQRIYQLFDDIIYRNSCQYNDIHTIILNNEGIRAQIRNAYYKCEYERINELSINYVKNDMELYYLRSFVDNGKTDGLIIEVPKDKLRTDMLSYYVNNKKMLDEPLFTQYLTEFSEKYKDSINNYNECVDPFIQELIQKLEEFGETFAGFKDPMFQDLAADFEKLAGPEEEDLTPTASQSFETQLKDFLNSKISVNVNMVPAQKGFEQIGEAFKQQAPTFEEFSQQNEEEEATYINNVNTADMLGRYKIRYLEGTDTSIEMFSQKLDTLISTLKSTYPVMDLLKTCFKTTADKEGKK